MLSYRHGATRGDAGNKDFTGVYIISVDGPSGHRGNGLARTTAVTHDGLAGRCIPGALRRLGACGERLLGIARCPVERDNHARRRSQLVRHIDVHPQASGAGPKACDLGQRRHIAEAAEKGHEEWE